MATSRKSSTKKSTASAAAKLPKAKTSAKSKAQVAESVASDKATSATVEPAKPSVVVTRKMLVDRVVAHSGARPGAVKSVIDAIMAELGDALSSGETVRLPSLGKLTVNRRKELVNGEVLVCKLRRKRSGASGETPLAEPAE